MTLVTKILLGLLGAGTLGTYIWNTEGSGKQGYDEDELRSKLDDTAAASWDSLTASQRQAILENYYETDNSWENAWGLFGGDREVLDTESLLQDLSKYNEMANAYAALERPVYGDYLTDARKQIAAENADIEADLDRLLNVRTNLYNDQLNELHKGYDIARSNLLSQQYQQNAQLMDTFNNSLEKSRRNAIEAGASAGIRIADNINNLLTVQNKQSATSMETANQLAQMMINQRNAEAGIRNNYADALESDASKRHDLKFGSEQRATTLASTNFNSAFNEFSSKEQELDKLYGVDNPLWNYRNFKVGSSTTPSGTSSGSSGLNYSYPSRTEESSKKRVKRPVFELR